MPVTISSDEIKQTRRKYGLSQKSFATLLGIGEASIVRYEQGAQPTRANANLLRAARRPIFMLECLHADGAAIPVRQYHAAEEYIYAAIGLPAADAEHGDASVPTAQVGRAGDSAGQAAASAGEDAGANAVGEAAVGPDGVPYDSPAAPMNRMYMYTLRQEVLNEQAANIIADLIRIEAKASHSSKGSQLMRLIDELLSAVSREKRPITTYEYCNHEKLSEVAGFLRCAAAMVKAIDAEVGDACER